MKLKDKAWRVIQSCKTPEHAKAAMRWLDLLGRRHPEVEVWPLKRELELLFDRRLS